MSINHAAISGFLGRDGELRVTSAGNSILTFSVGVTERRRASDGNYEDYINWIDCKVFGRRADALATYLTKGTKVSVEGRLHYSSWTDKNDYRHSKIEIYVTEIEFLSRNNNSDGGKRRNTGAAETQQQRASASQPQQAAAEAAPKGEQQTFAQTAPAPEAYSDADIPF